MSKKQKSILEIIRSNKLFPKILQDVLPDGELVPTKQGTGKMIPALAKSDAEFQQLLVHPGEKVRDLCVARQMAKSWPTHIRRIDSMSDQADCCNGLLPVALHYYGAHTGRFSGGEGINLQNLGGQGRAGSGTHPLIAAMRSLLSTLDGYTLGIVDSAQIEARLLAWMAGQNDLVEGFAKGEDIYSVFASKLFQCPIRKEEEDDPPIIENFLKIRRGFGKDGILGLGYGMGADKFYQRCMANEDLRPLFESGEYDWNFIKYIVDTYRTTYSKIPKFWQSVEKAFKWVIKYPHETVTVNNVQIFHGYGELKFSNDNGTVHLRLPSGRELTYRHCAIKRTTKGSEIRWHHGCLWGGSITENIIQSVARDLLAWWILEMEKVGLKVILTNHDEIICMLPEKDAKLDLQKMLGIMCTGPDWAAELPLGAEGCLSECYKK